MEGDRGAGGVRETGEERAGSGISTMAGSGREIQKGKLSLIVSAHHPVKETNSTMFLDFHLTFSAALNQNFNAGEKSKNANSHPGKKSKTPRSEVMDELN